MNYLILIIEINYYSQIIEMNYFSQILRWITSLRSFWLTASFRLLRSTTSSDHWDDYFFQIFVMNYFFQIIEMNYFFQIIEMNYFFQIIEINYFFQIIEMNYFFRLLRWLLRWTTSFRILRELLLSDFD